jgi:hypothetical protein
MFPLHPITGDYADFTEAELSAFRENLRNHGLIVPIVVWRAQTVDGRHRKKLCGELGIELRIDDITDKCKTEEEMIAYVRAMNEHRRANTKPLTTAQKRERIEAALKANPELANRPIAEKLGVDHKTVAEARDRLKATGEIPQLNNTIGKDGKSRKPPAPKSKLNPKRAPEPPVPESSRNEAAQQLGGPAQKQEAPAPSAPLQASAPPEPETQPTPQIDAAPSITPDEPAAPLSDPVTTRESLWLWDTLCDFERRGVLTKDTGIILGAMTHPMLNDVYRLAPQLATWLKTIGAAS